MIVILAFFVCFSLSNKPNEKEINTNQKNYKVYLQTKNGYELSNSKLFPKAGYVLNTTKSTCTGGGTLTQKENYSISFVGEAQNCTLYFDTTDVNTYTISFNAHGGSTPSSISKEEGQEVGTLPTSTREGYTFEGWYTAETGGLKVESNYQMPRANLELHAHWKINEYEVTYNSIDTGGTTSAIKKKFNYGTNIDLTPTAVKEGYTFRGWNEHTTDKSALASKTMPAENITLYAMFEKEVVITFNANGNTISKTSDKCSMWNNDTSCAIISPTITGPANTPNVIGYSTSATSHDSSWGSGASKNVSKNDTYYAQTKSNQSTYTISYTKGKGVQSLSKESDSCKTTLTYNGVKPGNLCEVTLPTITLKAGYENPAWSDGSSTASGTKKTLTANATLTASSTPIVYTITYDLDGGTVANANPTSYTVESSNITLNNPEKSGNIFNGWTGSNGTTPEKTVTITKGTTGNKTYTANYSVNSFKITYDRKTNGGTEDNEVVTYDFGETVDLTKTATKPGFDFVGWGLDKDDQSALDNLPMPEEDTTLFALFKKTVRIDFEENGNTLSKLYASCTIWNRDTSCTVTSPRITAPTNTPNVIGFSTASNTHTNSWSENTSKSVSSSTTYYAQTKSSTDTYTATYIKGTGVSEIGKESDTCTTPLSYNGATRTLTCTITLPTITLHDGYGDAKWNHTYNAGSTFTLDDDVTFTATGVPGSYTITYELNGGKATNPTTYTVETEGFTLNNPSKTGYTFTGWTGTNLSEQTTNVTIPKGSTGNREYEAHYNANTYTITFDADGGTVDPVSKEVTYDSTYGDLPTPTKAGYNFSHWELAGNTIESTTTVKITGNSTLKAVYEPKCIKVTLTSTGYTSGSTYSAGTTTFYYKFNTIDETDDTKTYIYTNNTCTTKLNDGSHITKARSLYTTSGWTTYQGNTNNGYYTSSGGSGTQYIDYDELVSENLIKNVTSDITLYAYWTSGESYRIKYDVGGGSTGSNAPTSATYNATTQISNPSKTFKFTGNANGTGATVGADTSTTLTFTGWKFDGDTSVAQNGAYVLLTLSWTNWSSNTSTTNRTYFRRLARDKTVTMTAVWTSASLTTPTLTKSGNTCTWNTKADGTGTSYTPNTSYTVSNTNVATRTLYAICTANNYNVSYNYNNGTKGTYNPDNVIYDTVTRISNPSKSVTLHFDTNNTGSTAASDITNETPFAGWTANNLTTTTAKYGTSEDTVTTSWSSASTKVKAEYFKNLAASGTVTLTANYDTVNVTLPSPTKTGHICQYNTNSNGTGTSYGGGSTYPITSTSQTTVDLFTICNANNYNINYVLNNGSAGANAPTTAKYDNVVTISNPSKTVTITGNVNNTGATITNNNPSKAQIFAGWTASGLTTSTAKYGSSDTAVTTSWSNASTKVTAQYFKNLTSTSDGTVTLTANWTGVALTLPSVTRSGSTCKWNTNSNGTGTNYNSGDNYTPVSTSLTNITLYAICSDDENPTMSVSSTANQKATSQTVTLSMTDNVGVTGYYFGKTSPTSSSTFTSITSATSTSQNVNVTEAGTYYAASKDAYGNISDVKTIEFNSYTVHNMFQNVSGSTYTTTHYTEASTYTYIAPKGTQLTPANIGTIPSHSRSGRFNGLSTGEASTTAATISKSAVTLNSNAIYSTWYTRNIIYFKYTLGDGDTLTPTTQKADGSETYTWAVNDSGNITRQVNTNTATDNFTSYRYGAATINLYDYNNANALNITKTGYHGKSSAQWICTSGCATANKSYTHASLSISNTDTELCDTTSSDCTIKVKVNWEANTYSIKFNANNGSGTMSNLSMTYGTAKNLTANAFTYSDYTFAGWNTKADGTGTFYTDKASVNNLTETNGATFNLYAQWVKVELTASTTSWTKNNVTVTATTTSPSTDYTTQMKLNSGSYTTTTTQTATQYGDVVTAIVKNPNGTQVATASKTINNIDKAAPTTTAPRVTSTANSITVTSNQTDLGSGYDTNASASGIKTIKYRLTNSAGSSGTWQTSNIFTGLTNGNTYYVQTQVTDNANNSSTSDVSIAKAVDMNAITTFNRLKSLNTSLTYKTQKPDFTTSATTDEGIFKSTDDYGDSYYWRGTPTTNYIKYGNWYWRIVRINGDGSLRLFYAGSSVNAGEDIGKTQFNAYRTYNDGEIDYTISDPTYVGYMYGTPNSPNFAQTFENLHDSTIKIFLDNWYEANIKGKTFEKYISDTMYCYDRTHQELEEVQNAYNLYFGVYSRMTIETFDDEVTRISNPSLICPQKKDAFTINDETKGNGMLKYGIGLLTADEATMAGYAPGSINEDNYLYVGSRQSYWLGTPSYYVEYKQNSGYNSNEKYAEVKTNISWIGSRDVNDEYYVVPIININITNATVTGKGTATNPFIVT